MEKTVNYNLNKPEATDPLRLDDFNENAEIIDAAMKELSAERVVVGSYTGDGTTERVIDLPFTPKMVLLFVRFGNSTVYERMYFLFDNFHFAVSDDYTGFATSDGSEFLENGLKVGGTTTNYKEKVNYYIAFQ